MANAYRELSVNFLHATLGERYRDLEVKHWTGQDYTRNFHNFTRDYPVILSTCHSLPTSLPAGFLLDYLIIDEASQVNLLAAGAALACCRNLIVVGDPVLRLGLGEGG